MNTPQPPKQVSTVGQLFDALPLGWKVAVGCLALTSATLCISMLTSPRSSVPEVASQVATVPPSANPFTGSNQPSHPVAPPTQQTDSIENGQPVTSKPPAAPSLDMPRTMSGTLMRSRSSVLTPSPNVSKSLVVKTPLNTAVTPLASDAADGKQPDDRKPGSRRLPRRSGTSGSSGGDRLALIPAQGGEFLQTISPGTMASGSATGQRFIGDIPYTVGAPPHSDAAAMDDVMMSTDHAASDGMPPHDDGTWAYTDIAAMQPEIPTIEEFLAGEVPHDWLPAEPPQFDGESGKDDGGGVSKRPGPRPEVAF